MIIPSWLVNLLLWAPAGAMKTTEKEVPGIFKVILPFLLVAVLLTVAAITVATVINVLKKRVPLEDTSEADPTPLSSGEMTRYESSSRVAPAYGKVLAVTFIIALVAFMFGGLYTMGRGSGTTEQLRKEGRERQQQLDNRQEASSAALEAVGEDGDKGSGGGGGGEFGGMLGGE